MSKFHINKHGVPAPCRATKGNCPLGGDSGDEGHFDTKEEAQEYADKVNEAEYSFLPVVDSDEQEQHSYNEEDLENMRDKDIAVEYDGKSFAGKVIGVHHDGDGSDNNGIIIQDDDGNVKHIKSHRLTKVDLEEGEEGNEEEPLSESEAADKKAKESYEAMLIAVAERRKAADKARKARGRPDSISDKEVAETGSRLTSLIGNRRGSVKAPELSKDDTRSIDDLDTLVETRGEFITSQEHDPVKNVQSMFDHVAGKSGKLDRYNDSDNPYLESHGYDFNKSISNHKNYLQRDGYLDSVDRKVQFADRYGKTPRGAFDEDVEKHRKLNDYSQDLAVEYGKDFEKKVVLSGKYNLEDQKRIQGEYRKALADKVGKHVQNYGEED